MTDTAGLLRMVAVAFSLALAGFGPQAAGVACAEGNDGRPGTESSGRIPKSEGTSDSEGTSAGTAGAAAGGAAEPSRRTLATEFLRRNRQSGQTHVDVAGTPTDSAAPRDDDVGWSRPDHGDLHPVEALPLAGEPGPRPDSAVRITAPDRDTAVGTASPDTFAVAAPHAVSPTVFAPQNAFEPAALVADPEPQPGAPAPTPAVNVAVGSEPAPAGKLLGVFSGDDRTAPGEPPPSWPMLGWTMLAAAARERLAPTVGLASTTATAATTWQPLAIPATPLFTALRLQHIPVVGPLLVTPIVTLVNHIPVVSDLLHPILGYPLLPNGYIAPRDVRVVSFDGTQINVHFMPATGLLDGQSAPTVLLASALGMPGATNLNGTPLDGILADAGGQVGVATLRNAGYNVVTWDPRGEYFSGGLLEMDSPDYEARDVSAVIDWVAELPAAQMDGPADPRVGMAGGSYGGPIQLVTAASDPRVDAIVPVLAWNTLNSAIYPNEAFKSGLGVAPLMFALMRVDPRFFPAVIQGAITGDLTAASQDLIAARGPGPARGFPDLVSRISAPTLLIQGTVDTLVSPKQADITARSLIAQGVPTKVIWFCGGHGLCLTRLFDFSAGPLIEQRTVAWLDRYVKGEPVSTGPAFEWVDQRGQRLSSDRYPAPAGQPIVTSRSADEVLPLIPFVGGSGPMLFVLPIGGTKALNAVNLTTPVSATTTYIVGEPQVTLRYAGTGFGDHVYAQLVDDTTSVVLGNQVTPIPVILDGESRTVTVALQPVAHTLGPGETATLQLFAWAADYAANPSLGALTVSDLGISLPTMPEAYPAGAG